MDEVILALSPYVAWTRRDGDPTGLSILHVLQLSCLEI